MGKYTNNYGMELRWGPDETRDSRGGHLGANGLNGNQIIEIPVNLNELKDGVAVAFPGIKIPAGAMILKTSTFVTKPGVGAASVDFGVKGATVTDEDGLVGGCPVTDEGELHEHMDETATAIGVVTAETVKVTCKANGTFTDGTVVFYIEYRASADKRPGSKLVSDWKGFGTVDVKVNKP